VIYSEFSSWQGISLSVNSRDGPSVPPASVPAPVRAVTGRSQYRFTSCRRHPFYCFGASGSSIHGLTKYPGRFSTILASLAHDGGIQIQ